MFTDGVGVDAVVELGEGAVEVPGEGEAAVFVVLETLEFLDEVELKLDGDLGGKLEGNVLVGICSAVAAGLRDDPNCTGLLDPLFGRECKAVQTGLDSNPVEFDGIKSRVVEPLPDAEEFHSVPVPKPVPDHIVGVVWILVFRDVRKTYEIFASSADNANRRTLNIHFGFF